MLNNALDIGLAARYLKHMKVLTIYSFIVYQQWVGLTLEEIVSTSNALVKGMR